MKNTEKRINTKNELLNLIETTSNLEAKKKLQQVVKKLDKSDEVFTCSECGFTYKYNGKTRHLQSKKHLETIRTGIQYKSKTSGFSKRKDELDPDTLKRKQEWYRMKYLQQKANKSTTNTCG